MSTFKDTILKLLTSEPREVIIWLQEKKLLKSKLQCEACANPMTFHKINIIDGYYWRCMKKACENFRKGKSIRTGSVFEKSKVPLRTWIHLMYLWAEGVQLKQACSLASVSKPTGVACFSFFRSVCVTYFQHHPIRLGGPQIVVECDESAFAHKVKYHRGRGPAQTVWVFGLADRSVKPALTYMEVVEKRDANTLLPIIKKVVRPGTIIHSDEWRSYCRIQELGFEHRTVNHSVSFINPTNGVHTQTIESNWNRKKSFIKSMRGCRRDLLTSYLNQFMWFERHSTNSFDSLCNQIAMQHKVA